MTEEELQELTQRAKAGDPEAQVDLGDYWQDESLEEGSDHQEAFKWYAMAAQQGNPVAQFWVGYALENGLGVAPDSTEAARLYTLAAEQGDVDAQRNLGCFYQEGVGVAQDYAEAARLYALAAEQGDAYAQWRLGRLYENGTGVAQDYAEAARLYALAAEQGDAYAQWRLGRLYENGTGVAQDYAEAARLYRLAAEQGITVAQCSLGLLHVNGEGVAQDYAEAARLYALAAEQGDAYAQWRLGWLYETGDGVAQDYAEAARLYALAAEQGDGVFQWFLGRLYENGTGVAQDYAEAARLYRLAAEQGITVAQCSLGLLHVNGEGVAQDYAEAARLFALAAEQGNAEAQWRLGWLYEDGNGVAQSFTEAARLYALAAEQEDASAQCFLASLHERAQGVRRDYAEAARLYTLAADQGQAYAQGRLGYLYEFGKGVKKDYVEAARLYALAAEQGDAYAQWRLGCLYEAGKGVPQDFAEAKRLYRAAAAQGNKEAKRALSSVERDGGPTGGLPGGVPGVRFSDGIMQELSNRSGLYGKKDGDLVVLRRRLQPSHGNGGSFEFTLSTLEKFLGHAVELETFTCVLDGEDLGGFRTQYNRGAGASFFKLKKELLYKLFPEFLQVREDLRSNPIKIPDNYDDQYHHSDFYVDPAYWPSRPFSDVVRANELYLDFVLNPADHSITLRRPTARLLDAENPTPDQGEAPGVLPPEPPAPPSAEASAPEAPPFSLKDRFPSLLAALARQGFSFAPWQVAAYLTALRTRPFVILAGVSGTGKSALPRLVSRHVGGVCATVPVSPSWTDSAELIGYRNLNGTFCPGRFYTFCEAARSAPETPHTLVLDEMNLARVEHYFAEVLSAMEEREWLPEVGLSEPGIDVAALGDDGPLALPRNLALVGTVNMDESTMPFSKKVLDRAFVLEFSDIDLARGTEPAGETVPETLPWPTFALSPAAWRPGDVGPRGEEASRRWREVFSQVVRVLQEANEHLRRAQLQVAYRVRDEIALFVWNAQDLRPEFRDDQGGDVDPLDLMLSMKLLPRITGGSDAVRNLLDRLLEWAVGSGNAPGLLEAWRGAGEPAALPGARFPRCAARLGLMRSRLDGEGYTSFWL